MTILLAEQNVAMALRLATRAVVLSTGGVVFDGSPEALLADRDCSANISALARHKHDHYRAASLRPPRHARSRGARSTLPSASWVLSSSTKSDAQASFRSDYRDHTLVYFAGDLPSTRSTRDPRPGEFCAGDHRACRRRAVRSCRGTAEEAALRKVRQFATSMTASGKRS
jgi:hypothetical protein